MDSIQEKVKETIQNSILQEIEKILSSKMSQGQIKQIREDIKSAITRGIKNAKS